MGDAQVAHRREKGFTQLTRDDFERDGDYWLQRMWWAEQQGLIYEGVRAALFPLLLEVMLAQREGVESR